MKKVVAIVGMSGAGKSIASSMLEEMGWKKIYFGGAIMEKMHEASLEITPANEKMMREKVRAELGMGAVAKILLPKILEYVQTYDTVLDGLYSWDELKVLQEELKGNLKVIAVTADRDLRHDRIGHRPVRPFTKDEAVARDISEIENLAKAGPIAMADYYIDNNSSDLEIYRKRLLEILEEI